MCIAAIDIIDKVHVEVNLFHFHFCTHTYTHTHLHTHIHTHTHSHSHIHTHTYVYILTHMHTHTHAHTHAHSHTHTQHDPSTTSTCSPGGSRGNYIMYPRATDGTDSNNNQFSQCSIDSIRPVLQTKSGCFTGMPRHAVRLYAKLCTCTSAPCTICTIPLLT